MECKQNYKRYQELLLESVGRFGDYRRYHEVTESLEEHFDEREEIYHFTSWEANENSTIVDKAYRLLMATNEAMEELYDLAEEDLYRTFCEIIALDSEEQTELLGIIWPHGKISLQEFREMLTDWEWNYYPEDALNHFLDIVCKAKEQCLSETNE